MKPDISEFSYGFAITRELVDWSGQPLTAAPLLPSLTREGQLGYDLKFDNFGFPIFLQFKMSDYMKKRNANEVQQGVLDPPFYRMYLRSRRYSNQHQLLLELENRGNLVYYVAPSFHSQQEFNDNYRQQTIARKSIFVQPSQVGNINDDDTHCISFKSCSEQDYSFSPPTPIQQKIDFTNFTCEVFTTSMIQRQDRLRKNLQLSVQSMISILESNDYGLFEDQLYEYYNLLIGDVESYRFEETPSLLQQIDSLARVFFDSQIFIVSQRTT